MSWEIRRGSVIAFDSTAWTAQVLLDGADLEIQMPVGQWIPSAMMIDSAEVACLVFGGTNTDDGVVLGPYGSVSLWNFPAIGAAANGALLIGNGTGMVLATITGTANRVTVTNGAGTITLTAPQDIATGSSPTFASLTLTGDLAVTGRIETSHGTWTPTFKGSGTAGIFTYTAQVGTYVKVGKLVYIYCRVTISAIGTPPTGNITIEGLPFTSEATNLHGLTLSRMSNFKFNAAGKAVLFNVPASATNIVMAFVNDNAATTAVTGTEFVNASCDLVVSGWYAIP